MAVEPGDYVVETGVHGAMRINRREYPTHAAAHAAAKRWSESNSQGHYWAVMSKRLGDGTLGHLLSFNLKGR